MVKIVAESSEFEYKPGTVITCNNNKRKLSTSIEDFSPKTAKLQCTTHSSTPSNAISSKCINLSSTKPSTSGDSCGVQRSNKQRGRPPKPVSSLLDQNKITNLSPEDQKYRQLRNKNNEASRRSRKIRKNNEMQLEDEARKLEAKLKFLECEERKLIRNCEQLREAVMNLALL